MKVEIWSDVRCPFCYIGKHKFEAALEKFSQKSEVEVIWRSYQLDPNVKTQPGTNTLEYFAESKGVSTEEASEMFQHASQMAAEAGLNIDFSKTIVANSFNAHRLLQFAITKNLGSEMEEKLFQAYFEEGKNIDDSEILLQLGTSLNLKESELKELFSGSDFAYEVKQDEMQAANIGVSGVPFFLFNEKYAVSGAQPESVFLETMEKAANTE